MRSRGAVGRCLHVADEPDTVAGNLHLLVRRRYLHERETVELPATSAWNAVGALLKALAALAEPPGLASVSAKRGGPVTGLALEGRGGSRTLRRRPARSALNRQPILFDNHSAAAGPR